MDRNYLQENAPDYSKCTKQFKTWAYSATYNGWFQTLNRQRKFVRLEDSPETPIATTTKESLQEYKDAGFNTLLINYVFPFKTFEDRFATSRTKQIMDWAHEVGLKCIIFEGCTRGLASTRESLINPEKADGRRFFNSQEEIDEFVKTCIGNIVTHPAFHGFSLLDEPPYTVFPAFGQVCKAVWKIKPDAYICMNLLGLAADGKFTSSVLKYCEGAWDMTAVDGYTKYIEHYAECTGAPYIQVDVYPMRLNRDTGEPIMTTNAIRTPQFLAEWCKNRNMELHYVLQSSSFDVGFGDSVLPWLRKPNKTDMYWQTNVAMAFGINSFAYWNYYPVVNTASEHYDHTSSFLDLAGNKNEMYYWMQDIHGEMQKMAKALLNFSYQSSRVFLNNPMGNCNHLQNLQDGPFTKLGLVTLESTGALLVSELYDKQNNRFGYFVTNATDPLVEQNLQATLTFNGYDKVQIYDKGEVSAQPIEDNELPVVLAAGQGIFVIPY